MTPTNANVSDLLLNTVDAIGTLLDVRSCTELYLTDAESALLVRLAAAIGDTIEEDM